MRQLFKIFLVIIVTTGSSYSQDANGDPVQPHHVYGKGIQQPYGQGPLAACTVQWEPMDTTFTLTIFTDPDLLEITSIKYFGGHTRAAETIKVDAKADIRIATTYTHAIYLKTIFGVTSILFIRDPATGKGVVLGNGRVFFLLDTATSFVHTDPATTGMDLDAYRNIKWQWHPIYDLWVSRQQKAKTAFIDIKKENLVY